MIAPVLADPLLAYDVSAGDVGARSIPGQRLAILRR